MFKKFLPILLSFLFIASSFVSVNATALPSTVTTDLAQYTTGLGTYMGISEGDILANQIGSSACKPGFLQFTSVTLTPTQIKGMYAAPVQLIPAPAVGTISVDYAMARFTYTDSYTSGGAVDVQYTNTVNGGGTKILATLPAAVLTGSSSVDTFLPNFGTSAITAPTATGVYISNATGAFATGATSTLTIYIWYSIN